MRDGTVAIFEDNGNALRAIRLMVTLGGNEVVIATDHVAEADRLITNRIRDLGSLSLDCALVDKLLLGGNGDEIVTTLLATGMSRDSIFNISGEHDLDGIPFRLGKDPLKIALALEGFIKDSDRPEDVVHHTQL